MKRSKNQASVNIIQINSKNKEASKQQINKLNQKWISINTNKFDVNSLKIQGDIWIPPASIINQKNANLDLFNIFNSKPQTSKTSGK